MHHHFLWLLVGAYSLAAWLPGPGEVIRKFQVVDAGQGLQVTLPMLLLGGLLFNGGLGAETRELAGVVKAPGPLLLGLVGNVLVPIGFLFVLALGLRLWPDWDEAQCLLVGLAIVAAMPVAGSSTAWSQNANGSAALSLGMVILSTVLSPLTTPLTLAVVEPLTGGDFAVALEELRDHGTGNFLFACVVVPSLGGMACRRLLGERVRRVKPVIKMTNSVVLLVLCYANASSVLPQIAEQPDWDFLGLCLGAVLMLCVAAFAAGLMVAKLLRASDEQTRSLVFALGMSNNGTGIVLACSALATLPGAVLPVLIYNLAQHLVAGGVNRRLGRT
jgi:BASS family bile acid:Na+ symporter